MVPTLLRVRGDEVTGHYGSFLTRSDLAVTKYGQDIELVRAQIKHHAMWSWWVGISAGLMLFTAVANGGTEGWRLDFGGFTIPFLIIVLIIAVIRIVIRRKERKAMPTWAVFGGPEHNQSVILASTSEQWVKQATLKLRDISPGTAGDWELDASIQSITQIR